MTPRPAYNTNRIWTNTPNRNISAPRPNNDRSQVCWNCGKTSHIKRNCQSRPQYNPNNRAGPSRPSPQFRPNNQPPRRNYRPNQMEIHAAMEEMNLENVDEYIATMNPGRPFPK